MSNRKFVIPFLGDSAIEYANQYQHEHMKSLIRLLSMEKLDLTEFGGVTTDHYGYLPIRGTFVIAPHTVVTSVDSDE